MLTIIHVAMHASDMHVVIIFTLRVGVRPKTLLRSSHFHSLSQKGSEALLQALLCARFKHPQLIMWSKVQTGYMVHPMDIHDLKSIGVLSSAVAMIRPLQPKLCISMDSLYNLFIGKMDNPSTMDNPNVWRFHCTPLCEHLLEALYFDLTVSLGGKFLLEHNYVSRLLAGSVPYTSLRSGRERQCY